MKLALCVSIALLVTPALAADKAPTPGAVRHVEDGVLDRIDLHVERMPAAEIVVVRPFSTEGADLGTGGEGGKAKNVSTVEAMKSEAPLMLTNALVSRLRELGSVKEVRADDGSAIPAGAIIVEGRFLQLDPGSRAKRYWVGFGAGHSGVEVEGRVLDGSGKELATFTQRRIGAMGVAGGDSAVKMRKDATQIGRDIADFLHAWATGGKLTG